VRHGILAREVVLQGRHDGEQDREGEFEEIYRRYREHFAPVGPLEEMLVERIATTYWRLHRVLIAERGEIAKNVDWEHERGRDMDPHRARTRALAEGGKATALGMYYLRHILQATRQTILTEGRVTNAAMGRVDEAFDEPNTVAVALRRIRQKLWDERDETTTDEAVQVKEKELVLGFLEKELARCEDRLPEIEERERYERRAREAAAFLPAEKVVEKILRYETSLERQLYRAINQLERVQRMRNGEAVPPPLTMEVSRRY